MKGKGIVAAGVTEGVMGSGVVAGALPRPFPFPHHHLWLREGQGDEDGEGGGPCSSRFLRDAPLPIAPRDGGGEVCEEEVAGGALRSGESGYVSMGQWIPPRSVRSASGSRLRACYEPRQLTRVDRSYAESVPSQVSKIRFTNRSS